MLAAGMGKEAVPLARACGIVAIMRIGGWFVEPDIAMPGTQIAGNDILIDVHMITFNHVRFIEQALASVLAQRTDGRVRLIVGDDCSTDGTREIVSAWAGQHPQLIHAILHKHQLGRHGKNNFINVLRQCRAKYVAFLEGDDYWTDPNKLQIQVDFLERNANVVGCFHNAKVVNDENALIRIEMLRGEPWGHGERRFNQFDCLYSLGSSYPSCSLMIRSSALCTLPPWYVKDPTDYATDLLITNYGDLAFLPYNMGAYRVHAGGIWQGMSRLDQHMTLFDRYRTLAGEPFFKERYETSLKALMKHKIRQIAEFVEADYGDPSYRMIWHYLRCTRDSKGTLRLLRHKTEL